MMHAKPLFCELAQLIGALQRCKKDPAKVEWQEKHETRIKVLVKQHLPSGAGFDNGTTIDLDKSTEERLVFNTSYHHMHGKGFYNGWTEHTVTIKPSLAFEFTMTIGGRNRNDIKDHIGECFDYVLRQKVDAEGKIAA